MANRLGPLSTIRIDLDSSVSALFLPHFARGHYSMFVCQGRSQPALCLSAPRRWQSWLLVARSRWSWCLCTRLILGARLTGFHWLLLRLLYVCFAFCMFSSRKTATLSLFRRTRVRCFLRKRESLGRPVLLRSFGLLPQTREFGKA